MTLASTGALAGLPDRPLRPFLISLQASVLEALQRLEASAEGVLLLVGEDGGLRRTITDGDVRRLLLNGATLDQSLTALPAREPIRAVLGTDPAQALALMNRHQIDHLPVVDAEGLPVSLILRRDLDAKILLSTPHLSEHEMAFVQEAFRTNWIAPLGPNVDAFEKELAAHVGIGHAAALSSGTAALHLAMKLVGVGPGDTVFCSSLTFVASANPVLYEGAQPVFIDSEPATWNMSPVALERAFQEARARGQLPKAVVVVNLYGQSADMDPLVGLCDRYGVPLIEDAAESLGATYRGRPSGTFGRIGVFSFNGNKIITTSGGGMLVSDDAKLVAAARALSTQAREDVPWYEHTKVGYNYRMSNILAGIGRGQLRVLEERVDARRRIFDRYRAGLQDMAAVEWMPEANYGRSTRWLSVCMLNAARTAVTPTELIRRLAQHNIEARHVWKPMHRQPLFAGCAYVPHDGDRSFSDEVFAAGICLPSGSNMTDDQQDRIIHRMTAVLKDG